MASRRSIIYSYIFYCFVAICLASDKKSETEKGDDNKDISVDYLNVKSQIQARFATTFVLSKVSNLGKTAKEVTFTAQLPEDAFISNFSMQIGDKTIYGDVKEKEKAKAEFEAAKARGESAGHIAQKPRETNAFEISVNVAAESKVKFNLTYQEILKRVHGVYKHIINLQPDQPVRAMNVEINIVERGEITKLKVPKFGSKVGEKTNKELLLEEDEKNAVITKNLTKSVSNVQISYDPQAKSSKDTIAGQFVVLYDLERSNNGGEIQVVDGYFVHFFAPEGLPKGNKHVVFVLDKSGSMLGRKFEQLKEAMKVILNDLDPEDLFNIIFFSDSLENWKSESVKANADNIKAAQLYVADTEANGGTNIFDALKGGFKVLESTKANSLASMLLFLTDGQPTVGQTNGDVINKDITELNKNGGYIINSIGFGNDADILLMKKVSANNKGLAKKVYEDSDATIQLTGFYEEISTPLLSSVKISYLNDTVDVGSIVQADGENYFQGGELVTIGKLQDNVKSNSKEFNAEKDLKAEVTGVGKKGTVELKAVAHPWHCPRFGWGCCPRPIPLESKSLVGDIVVDCCWGGRCPPPLPFTTPKPEPLPSNTLGGFIERMWAFKTIKKLLKQNELGLGNDTDKTRALELSLKYHFVTELTSMVVIQPNETNATALEENKKEKIVEEAESARSFGGSGSGFGTSFNKLAGRPAAFGGGFGPSLQGIAAPHPPPPPVPRDRKGDVDATNVQQATFAGFTNFPTTNVFESKCHLNIFVIHQVVNDSINYLYYEPMLKDLVETLRKSKDFEKPHFYVLALKQNQSQYDTKVTNEITTMEVELTKNLNLSEIIRKIVEKRNENDALNVALFVNNNRSMDYAVKSAPFLLKENFQLYAISEHKLEKKKEKEILSIVGNSSNSFVKPSAHEIIKHLKCH